MWRAGAQRLNAPCRWGEGKPQAQETCHLSHCRPEAYWEAMTLGSGRAAPFTRRSSSTAFKHKCGSNTSTTHRYARNSASAVVRCCGSASTMLCTLSPE